MGEYFGSLARAEDSVPPCVRMLGPGMTTGWYGQQFVFSLMLKAQQNGFELD